MLPVFPCEIAPNHLPLQCWFHPEAPCALPGIGVPPTPLEKGELVHHYSAGMPFRGERKGSLRVRLWIQGEWQSRISRHPQHANRRDTYCRAPSLLLQGLDPSTAEFSFLSFPNPGFVNSASRWNHSIMSPLQGADSCWNTFPVVGKHIAASAARRSTSAN